MKEGLELLSAENLKLFMRRKDNAPLRTIILKLINFSTSAAESIEILKFLI
jgi:hypothetical protein